MAISVTNFTGTNGTWGTEFSLTNASTTVAAQTTAGIYSVALDLNALALGDTYELRLYEKARAADTQRALLLETFNDAQGVDGAIMVSPSFQLGAGWDFTLKRTAGSDHTITWSVRGIT
jgi:hypothetical protein